MIPLVHSDSFGVRTVVVTLTCKDDRPDIFLYPITVFGEKSYFFELEERLSEYAIVITDGYPPHGAPWFLRTYRRLLYLRRFGLISRRDVLSKLPGTQKANLDASAYKEAWRSIPLWTKMLMLSASVYYCLSSSKEGFIKRDIIQNKSNQFEIGRDGKLIEIRDSDPSHYPRCLQSSMRAVFDAGDIYISDFAEELKRRFDLVKCDQKAIAIAGSPRSISAAITLLSSQYGYRVVKSDWIEARAAEL